MRLLVEPCHHTHEIEVIEKSVDEEHHKLVKNISEFLVLNEVTVTRGIS